MTGQNGSNANQSGANAETIIDCVMQILRGKGYHPVSQYWIDTPRGEPIFSNKLKADFCVMGIPGYEAGLIVSSKRQDSSGTVQQKLHYHILHEIKECYPYPTILVLTGDYCSQKVKIWALQQRDNKTLIDVFFTYEEILRWAENIPPFNRKKSPATWVTLPLFDQD